VNALTHAHLLITRPDARLLTPYSAPPSNDHKRTLNSAKDSFLPLLIQLYLLYFAAAVSGLTTCCFTCVSFSLLKDIFIIELLFITNILIRHESTIANIVGFGWWRHEDGWRPVRAAEADQASSRCAAGVVAERRRCWSDPIRDGQQTS